MTESIYGAFECVGEAQLAEAELLAFGINKADFRFNESGLRIMVLAKIGDAVDVRTIIERHGGRTEVDDIPDPGTIVQDPLEFNDRS